MLTAGEEEISMTDSPTLWPGSTRADIGTVEYTQSFTWIGGECGASS